MQEKTVLRASDIERLKREAKQIRKSSGIPLSQAQDAIAQRLGHKNWSLLRRDQAKVKGPTAEGLHRACVKFIRSVSDSAIEGLCKGGVSLWAPVWQVQSGDFGEVELLGSHMDISTSQYAFENRLLMLANFGEIDESFVFAGDEDYEEDEDGNPVEPAQGRLFTPERGRAELLSIDYGWRFDDLLSDLDLYLNPPEREEMNR